MDPYAQVGGLGERYDTGEALAALNALYADLRLFQNLFQPSMELMCKVRVGSRLIRRYDRPQTPLERVQACPAVDPQEMAALAQVLKRTDPFALSRRIDRHLEHLWALATRVSRTPRETAPRPRTRGPSLFPQRLLTACATRLMIVGDHQNTPFPAFPPYTTIDHNST